MANPRGARREAPGSEPGRVFMIGSEAAPFSKTGGLADVLGRAARRRSRVSGGTSPWRCRAIAASEQAPSSSGSR